MFAPSPHRRKHANAPTPDCRISCEALVADWLDSLLHLVDAVANIRTVQTAIAGDYANVSLSP